jgi:hypothetical protein
MENEAGEASLDRAVTHLFLLVREALASATDG